MSFDIPYKGSKSLIAKDIVAILPGAGRFHQHMVQGKETII